MPYTMGKLTLCSTGQNTYQSERTETSYTRLNNKLCFARGCNKYNFCVCLFSKTNCSRQ
uniref:Uncharacterized protein n=1 Tax=Anguilla anguilla TaxID=7936 RepID=A0A0E9R6A4_ANGAN